MIQLIFALMSLIVTGISIKPAVEFSSANICAPKRDAKPSANKSAEIWILYCA